MRILVISQYFYPEQFRVNDIVIELVKRGNIVSVVTGLPNYPEGEVFPGYENAYQCIEDYNGAKVYRCNLRPRHKGAKNLLLNYISFVTQSKKVLKKIKPDFDVIYVYGLSPITLALPAIWYKKKYGIPVFYYCLDVWPDSVRDENNGGRLMSKANPIYLFAKILSKYIYKNVDYIASKCDDFIQYIHDVCNIDFSKMSTLYEHAESSYLTVKEQPTQNGIIDFMFLGNIGDAQNCDKVIEAFLKTNYKGKAKLHFVGDGSSREKLQKIIQDNNFGCDVIFHGKYPITEINQFYEFADVCVLSLANTTACGLTPPGKLYSYMAASRPIIASINGSAKTIIEEANCGFTCSAGDVDGLAKLMQKIINDSECLKLLGENGRRYFVENFLIDDHLNKLIEKICILVGDKNDI